MHREAAHTTRGSVHQHRLARAQRRRSLQQQVRTGSLGCEARQRHQVGVIIDDCAQRFLGHGKLGVRPLFHQCHDLAADLHRRLWAGRDHDARDGKATHLRQLYPADPRLRIVVDTKSLTDIGEIDPDRDGFDEQLSRPGRGAREVKVSEDFRSAEPFILDRLHRRRPSLVR